jgi:hypothetical protein
MSAAGEEEKEVATIVADDQRRVYEEAKGGCAHGTIASVSVSGLATSLLSTKDAGGVKDGSFSYNKQPGNVCGDEFRTGMSILRHRCVAWRNCEL